MCRLSRNSGSLKRLGPWEPIQDCNRVTLLLRFTVIRTEMQTDQFTLGCWQRYLRPSFFWDVMRRILVFTDVLGQPIFPIFLDCFTLGMGPKGCPEKSNYKFTPRKVPKETWPHFRHFRHGGNEILHFKWTFTRNLAQLDDPGLLPNFVANSLCSIDIKALICNKDKLLDVLFYSRAQFCSYVALNILIWW
jgi:hypothetical protein